LNGFCFGLGGGGARGFFFVLVIANFNFNLTTEKPTCFDMAVSDWAFD
jgi:hypothetical protein